MLKEYFSLRDPSEMEKIPVIILRWFLLLYIFHPLSYLAVFAISIGYEYFVAVASIILVIAPPAIGTCSVLFFIINKRLTAIINAIGTADEEAKARIALFLRRYQIQAPLLVLAGCGGGPIATVFIAILRGELVEDAFFFLLMGEMTCLVVVAVFYFVIKVNLYPLRRYVDFEPLTIFMKISIPVICTVMTLLILMGLAVYNVSVSQGMAVNKKLMSTAGDRKAQYIEAFFREGLAELTAYEKLDVIKGGNPASIDAFLKSVHRNTGNTEIFFYADTAGNGLTSVGKTVKVGDRDYFLKAMRFGTPAFSDPITSRATGNEVVACAVPVRNGGKMTGLIASTVLIRTVKEQLAVNKIAPSEEIFILSARKIVFQRDPAYNNKTVGVDIRDNGTTVSGTGTMVSAGSGAFFNMVLDGRRKFAYKKRIDVLDKDMVIMVNQEDFLKDTNFLIRMIIGGFILLTVIMIISILQITRRISSPVHETGDLLARVSDGDLAVSYDRYMPDELGSLGAHINLFIESIKSMIGGIKSSTELLNSTMTDVEGLVHKTSTSLNNQFAGIEETSTTLDEITGISTDITLRLERIAGLAAGLSTILPSSFEKLHTIMTMMNDSREIILGNQEQLKLLGRQTTQINDVMKTIYGMTNQTKIIAFNAALEAASGASGEDLSKRFNVIVSEIRRLAESVGESSDEIKEKLTKIQQTTDEMIGSFSRTVEAVNNTHDYTGEVVEDFTKVRDGSAMVYAEIGEISESIRNESASMEQINQALADIKNETVEISGVSMELSEAFRELIRAFESLDREVRFFRL